MRDKPVCEKRKLKYGEEAIKIFRCYVQSFFFLFFSLATLKLLTPVGFEILNVIEKYSIEFLFNNLNVGCFTNILSKESFFSQCYFFFFQVNCGNKFHLPGKYVLNTAVIFSPSTVITSSSKSRVDK